MSKVKRILMGLLDGWWHDARQNRNIMKYFPLQTTINLFIRKMLLNVGKSKTLYCWLLQIYESMDKAQKTGKNNVYRSSESSYTQAYLW